MTRRPGELEEAIRGVLRRKQYSLRTEESYIGWYRRYVRWSGMRHPEDMGAREVEGFLTHLAVSGRVVAATQNQALNALIFLYSEVFGVALGDLQALRARQEKRLPVVLTQDEVRTLLSGVKGAAGLGSRLLTGAACGLPN